MPSIDGRIANQVRLILNTAGRIVGYRNPSTDQDEDAVLPTAAQVSALAGLGTTYAIARVLSQSGIPIVIPTSGSIGNNGALSGVTAMSDYFAPQGMYLYFPANAISAGSAAGLYYTLMSSTTAGTIYNNTYTSGIPSIPVSPTPFVTTGPGAFTQTTAADITLLSLTIDANSLGNNGGIFAFLRWTLNSSANNKILKVKLGASNVWDNSSAPLTTSGLYEHLVNVVNRGVPNRQQGNRNNNAGLAGGASGTSNNLSLDTTAALTLSITGQIAAATDFLGLSMHSIELRPAA